jgi:hypothetical protein
MPARFRSLADLSSYLLHDPHVSNYQGDHHDNMRWDLCIHITEDLLLLGGQWDSSPADGDFQIRIEIIDGSLRYTVTSIYNDSRVVDHVVRRFLPSFHASFAF